MISIDFGMGGILGFVIGYCVCEYLKHVPKEPIKQQEKAIEPEVKAVA